MGLRVQGVEGSRFRLLPTSIVNLIVIGPFWKFPCYFGRGQGFGIGVEG